MSCDVIHDIMKRTMFLVGFLSRKCTKRCPLKVHVYNIYALLYAIDLQEIMLELFVITRNMKKKKINSFEEVQKIKEAHTQRTNERKDTIKLVNELFVNKFSREYWNYFEEKSQSGKFY
ncbi:uncharacterized protein LOC111693656 [Trichogramma pretiosum]|uniref:uncharacterized protein LOC111693656 n=1 Tax=Trichogramma pretiosum TaxID=7493 RepID=UPI000C71AF7E|nr:uncharacterized protein LOC111693656 [Trichogramma pretiosum]